MTLAESLDMTPAPDFQMRRRLFAPEAFQHPAKMHIGMLWEIIERHTKPDQVILDPMGGIGTTMFACLLQRNVIISEMESDFLQIARDSWEIMRVNGPMLGYGLGTVRFVQEDAQVINMPDVDVILFSPPYEEAEPRDPTTFQEGSVGHMGKSSYLHAKHSKGNIANMKEADYWVAMKKVYARCAAILKPGGTLIIVVKDKTRAGKIVPLGRDNASKAIAAGFTLTDNWDRILYSQSFWRILMERRGIPVPKSEHVYVLTRMEERPA